MKKVILSILVLQLFSVSSFGQKSPVAIKTFSNQTFKGYLIKVDSVRITITKGLSKLAFKRPGRHGIQIISIADIKTIQLKGKNNETMAKGFLAGSAAGFGVYYLLDQNEDLWDDNESTKFLLKIGLTLVAVGGVIGVVSSFVKETKKEYLINGNPALMSMYLPELVGLIPKKIARPKISLLH
ncbi:MAG: hypothetical protein P1U70_21680 [Saprospiraceae bacterium]|jgi:hypothetical protein|nr:hypothetical protein [Saprospiraceae bacterium]